MFGWLSRLLRRPTGPRAGPADSLGRQSEHLARAFLERAGFSIVATNYRCPMGEVDLVARGEGRLVFVEVKARRQSGSPTPAGAAAFARPELAVTRAKQKKIGLAARYFCRASRQADAIVRFDVVAIDWPAGPGDPAIRHHRAAFRPDV